MVKVKEEESSKQSIFRMNTTGLDQAKDWILYKCVDGFAYIKDTSLPEIAKKTTTVGVDQIMKCNRCKLNEFQQQAEFMKQSLINEAMKSSFWHF